MRIRAHLDARDHPVGGGVDDAHRRRTVTADIDLAAVWRHHKPVWPLGDRDRTDDLVLGGVEDSHRIVFEEPHIGLRRSGGRERARCGSPPGQQDHDPQHHRHAL